MQHRLKLASAIPPESKRIFREPPPRRMACAAQTRTAQLHPEAVSIRRHDMARIDYDDQTAAAYKAVREVSRDGLGEWREAIRRHLSPLPGMTATGSYPR